MKNPKCFLLLKLFALSALLLLLTSSARAWRVSLPASSRAESVVVDAAGDIIAAGRAYYGSEVIKISGTTGQLLWQFNASHNEIEHGAVAIALDSHGDVFVLFATQRGVTKISGVTGQRIWTGIIGGSVAGCQNFYSAIAVDRDDNVVAAGTAGCLFSVGKLDGATGAERWHYEHEGRAYAVAVDPFGDVAAAGIMNLNFGTVKLRGTDGLPLWRNEINGTGSTTNGYGNEQANAVAMDKDGSVVAVGSTSNERDNPRDFTVVKYLADGTKDWIQIIDGLFRVTLTGNDNSDDTANAVVIDKDGSVIAAGFVQESLDIPRRPDPEHFHVIKISRNGNVVWSKPAEDLIPAPPGKPEYLQGRAFSLSVNSFGNVVTAGVHDGRFTLVKFWGRTGGRAWRRQLPSGSAGNGNLATGVVMDAASDVIAAGETIPVGGVLSQFTVVKLRRIDGLDYDSDPTPTPPETVVELAPLVYLHPDDNYRPGDPLNFIAHSDLMWSHQMSIIPCGDHTVAERDNIDVTMLGGDEALTANLPLPYSHKPRNTANLLCHHREDIALTTRDHTRPFDLSERDNVLGQEENYAKEGFFLDPDNDWSFREGNPSVSGDSIYPGAPVYYEYEKGEYVAYWFFYPYDDYKLRLPGGIVGDTIQAHEGDWERISIQLDQNDQPLNVFFYHHKDGGLVDRVNVTFDDTHPVVFSAAGSHASYPKEGYYPTDLPGAFDHAKRGPKWMTWTNLINVKTQPWYGFGGAWGEVSPLINIHTTFGDLSGGDFTGPLGPSKYKSSRDIWFVPISGRVTGVDGNGLADVKIKAFDERGNMAGEATTCANDKPACGVVGFYTLKSLIFGRSYTLVATKEGYSFTPAVRLFYDLREPQTVNFSVQDAIPPLLILPTNISVNATAPQGALVHFTVTATDNVTQNPRIVCTPTSGSVFSVGTTTAACTASDDAGNSAHGAFNIIVKGAGEQVIDLTILVKRYNLPKGTENSLLAKLQNAFTKLTRGDKAGACNQLLGLINEVQAQSNKKISASQANQILTAANRIRAVIGC